MKFRMGRALAAGLFLLLLAPSSYEVRSQSGGGYDLSWSTLEPGGELSSGGGFTLTGTAGQPDAPAGGVLSGVGFTLVGGFWSGTTNFALYLPVIRK